MSSTDAGEHGRYCFITRARCPDCWSADLHTQKTHPPETDGSVTRDTVCRSCGWRFFVVVEDPPQ